MASVNIPSTIDDPNYRYKMPPPRCKVEGSGNGIKTNHMNMRDVAQALKRNPEYVTKYLACELCVHGRYFENEGKAIFQGVHTTEDIATKLDGFIGSYVLCPSCHLPEIDLYVDKKIVMGKCNACGATSKVNNIHRVAAFIVKNPPEGSTVGGKPTKEEKRAAKAKAAADTNKKVDSQEGGERKKKVVKKKVVKKKKKTKTDGGEEFDLKSEAANLVMTRMREFFLDETSTPQTFFQEFRTVQLTQSFTASDRFYLALGALFGCGKEIEEGESFDGAFNLVSVGDFKNVLPYLSALAYDTPKESIEALQLFMSQCVTPDSYKAHYPLILKAFYDESIVDDEDVCEFYDQELEDENFLRAKKVLQPLIKWLATAESSGEESYEESSDEEPVQKTKKLGA